MKRKQYILSIALIILILTELTILAYRHHLRLDLTRDHHYTLSRATREIITNLQQPVTIIAYFSKKLPPDLLSLRRELINTLEDYKSISVGKIAYQVIDPGKDPELEQQAMKDGISPLVVEIREKDQARQQKAFMGLVIKYGDKKEVIPYINPDASLEYLITMNIKKLTVDQKPKVGILQGFGCPSFNRMQGFINALSVLYTPVEFHYDSTHYNLDQYKILAIIAPTDSLPSGLLAQIDRYLVSGGKLLLAYNNVDGQLQQNPPIGNVVVTGLEDWLKKYGVVAYQKFIVDAQCGTIQVQQSGFPFPISVSFPYFPMITTFANHPITKGLEAVAMSFVSPMEFKGDTNKIKFTPIAFTSEHTGLEKPPVFFTVMKQWSQADFPLKHLIVGATLQTKTWKMVIFSDGDFMQLPAGERFEKSDNVALAVNSIDWLADDLGITALRTKGISYKPIKQLSDTQKALVKYLNFALPIILVIILGLLRWRHNIIKQNKLKTQNHVDQD